MASLTSAPGVRVPVDVADLIIDEILNGDKRERQNLKSHALISREFLIASRKYLFHKVKLDFMFRKPTEVRRRYSLFEQVFTSTPEIACYIRELDIHENTLRNPTFKNMSTLPDIIGKLKGLTTFRIIGEYDTSQWEIFPPQFKQAVEVILLSTSIEKLELQLIDNVPIDLIGLVPYVDLRSVTLNLNENRFIVDQLLSRPFERSLKTLRLYDVALQNQTFHISHLLPPSCPLETLIIGMFWDQRLVKEIICQHAMTIKSLEFENETLFNKGMSYCNATNLIKLTNSKIK
ncbi:hypothetical protein BDQ17DRAFT_1427481 [Cyathus striatus]|nr:hypothetical protein BDQ17DRAFT_1427481 [Cyathus striatus]